MEYPKPEILDKESLDSRNEISIDERKPQGMKFG